MDEAWLNTVRLARDCGDISSLFPAGITRLWDLPHTLKTAIRMGLYFLKFEELPHEEDRPPKDIWLDAEKMKRWWAEVKVRQEERAKGESTENMSVNRLVKHVFPGVNLG